MSPTANQPMMENIYVAAFALTAVCLVFLVTNIFWSNQILNLSFIIANAAKGMKFEVTKGQITLEKILNSDQSERIDKARCCFSSAQEHIRTLILSRQKIPKWFNPLANDNLHKKLAALSHDLDLLISMSKTRYSSIKTNSAQTKSYDRFMNNLIHRVNSLENRIHSQFNHKVNGFRYLQYSLAVILFSAIVLTAWFTCGSIRSRRLAEQKLNKISQDLRRSENLLALVLDTTPDRISIKDENFRYLYVNKAYADAVGHPPEEIIGRREEEFYTNENVLGNLQAVISSQRWDEALVLNGRTIHKACDRMPIESDQENIFDTYKLPLPGDNGRNCGVLNLSRNITEQHRIKKAMEENESKLKRILSLAPIGIGMIKDGRFHQVNDQMEKMTGHTVDSLIGQSSRLLYISRKEFDRVRKDQASQIKAKDVAVIESMWRRKDGTLINVLYSSAPQEKGNLRDGIIFTAQDITPWKKAQVRLKASEEKFRLLAENTVDCIWLMDLNLNFRYINPSVRHVLGYTPKEWIGSSLADHFPPEEIEFMGKLIESELSKGKDGKGVVFETNIYSKARDIVSVEISCRILFDANGEPVGLHGTMRDITRRKSAEEEVQRLNQDLERRVVERTAQLNAANKELEAFAYSVSHDLRAPLRSIQGFGSALMEDYHDSLGSIGRDYLQRIQKNTKRMGELIEDMLTLSRTMRCEMKRETVNLSEIVLSIIDDLKSQDRNRHVEVVIEPMIYARGDSHLLRILLENLLGNAWKFTSKNKTTVYLKFGRNQKNGTDVYYIKDNGVGFDTAYSEKLFLVFQRLHSAEEFPGSGVGLTTVARIVQRHGGKIWADGKIGKGATFYFTL